MVKVLEYMDAYHLQLQSQALNNTSQALSESGLRCHNNNTTHHSAGGG